MTWSVTGSARPWGCRKFLKYPLETFLMLPVLPSSGTFLDRTTSTFLVAFLTATTWSCPLPARLGILRGDCGWTKARARGASAVSSKRNP